MNATTAEAPPVEDTAQIRAEIRRMGAEMERMFADMDESQHRIEQLSASTRRRLDSIRTLLHKNSSAALLSS